VFSIFFGHVDGLIPFTAGPILASRIHEMRISFLSFVAIAIAVVAAQSSSAGLAAQAGARERTLFVSAVNEKGETVDGLGPDAFVIREDGRRREVLRVSRATEPLDVALMVDNSQAATDEVVFLRDGLTRFVAAMGEQHRIALIGLAERPTAIVQYTTDRKQLTTAIGRLFSIGGSGMTLLDALYETSRGLRKRDSVRAAFVPVVTDGTEFTNRYAKDVSRELRESGAALHAVTIGRFQYSDEHSVRERSFLVDDGPKTTGGQRIELLVANPLGDVMERLARELSSQYKVVYGRADSLYNTGSVEIASGRPGITMRGTPAREPGGTK
jgi:VWFA-related protein